MPGLGRVGLVGGLDLVGRELRRCLPQSDLGVAEVDLLGSPAEAGTLCEVGDEPALVQPLTAEGLADAGTVLVCQPVEGLEAALAELGERAPWLVDLSGNPASGLGRAPAVVAELNGYLAAAGPVRSPHPVTVIAAVVLAALSERIELLRADLVGFLPAAERGRAGIEDLHRQTTDVLSFRPVQAGALGGRLAFDVLPPSSEPEREAQQRARADLLALLAGGLPALGLSLLRVPVFLGLALSLDLELAEEDGGELVEEILAESSGMVIHPAEAPPGPGALAEEEESVPGIHLSVLPSGEPGRVRLWATADWLRRGIAANALGILRARLAAAPPG